MGFANTIGFWAFLALIPLIILYLRRPKPKDQVIPSLMFILQNKKTSKRSAFLQRLITNLLLLLHLLALIGLAFAMAEPFVTLPYDKTLENTVIVLDASASMQAVDGGNDRFSKAISKAKGALSGRNSIILATNIPLILLEDEDSSLARDLLSSLEPKATSTNLGDAMLLAKDILGERPGKISVISDFSNVDGPDLLVVKRTLTSDEVVVEFIDVSNDAENAGITGLEVKKTFYQSICEEL